MPGPGQRAKLPRRSQPRASGHGRRSADQGAPFSVNAWLVTFEGLFAVQAWARQHDYQPNADEWSAIAKAWEQIELAPVGHTPGSTRADCELTLSRRKGGYMQINLHPHVFVMDEHGGWFDPQTHYYPAHLNGPRPEQRQ